MEVINHDAKVVPVIEEGVRERAGFLASINIPTILVSPDTMDDIYPPGDRVCVNDEALLSLLEKFSESKEWWDDKKWENELAECRRRCKDPTIALGIYARSTKIHKAPAIYLCPERIKESLLTFSPRAFTEVSTFVYLHELTHAFLDVRRHSPIWIEILEESMANAAGLVIYRGRTGEIEALVNRQPLEYRAAWFFAREQLLSDLLPSFKLVKMVSMKYREDMLKKWWEHVRENVYRRQIGLIWRDLVFKFGYPSLLYIDYLAMPFWTEAGLFTASLLAIFARR